MERLIRVVLALLASHLGACSSAPTLQAPYETSRVLHGNEIVVRSEHASPDRSARVLEALDETIRLLKDYAPRLQPLSGELCGRPERTPMTTPNRVPCLLQIEWSGAESRLVVRMDGTERLVRTFQKPPVLLRGSVAVSGERLGLEVTPR